MPEIRPGAIISRALQIYRDQAGTVLGAALIIFAIQFLLALLLPRLPFIAGLAAFILSVFYGGMVVNLVRDVQDGRRDHGTGELFRAVTPVLLPLLGLAIVAGIVDGHAGSVSAANAPGGGAAFEVRLPARA